MKFFAIALVSLLAFALAGCTTKVPSAQKPSPAVKAGPPEIQNAVIEAAQIGTATTTQVAQANILIPRTYSARTDDAIVQPLAPVPDMGGLLGQNKVFTDPRFGNARTLRATDGATGKPGQTLSTADGGAPTLWASDSRHFMVHTNGGPRRVLAFDPKTFRVANTSIIVKGGAVFAWRDPQMIFQLLGTELHQLTASLDWSAIATDVVIGDFRACLGANFIPTWNGTFLAKRDDATFTVAFSNEGGQGTGHYLVAFRVGKGCSMLDTKAGTVGGQWGAKGSIDDGALPTAHPLADRLIMHEGGGGQNEKFAAFGMTLRQPGGASGCLAGGCVVNSPYVWEVGTTHVRICGGFQCDGHAADGYLHRATGKKYTLHSYAAPSTPLTQLLKKSSFCSDMHGSWQNSTRLDVNPLFAVTTDVNPTSLIYPCAGYNEVIGVPADGSGLRYRFGQTFNTGTSKYFEVQNANGVVDQSGRWVLFVSDWGGTLGVEADGKTPRGDAFILEIK